MVHTLGKRGRKPKLHRVVQGHEQKHCGGCDQWLALDAFRAQSKRWDGLQPQCGSCTTNAGRAWRQKRKAFPLPKIDVSEKRCPSCEQVKPRAEFASNRATRDGLHAYCLACNRTKQAAERARRGEDYLEMRRRYRRTESGRRAYNRYRQVFPAKVEAQKLAQLAMRRGELVRPDTCSQCDEAERVEAHHDDYSRPLDVRWLCRWCHQAWHREHGEAANPAGHVGAITQIARS